MIPRKYKVQNASIALVNAILEKDRVKTKDALKILIKH